MEVLLKERLDSWLETHLVLGFQVQNFGSGFDLRRQDEPVVVAWEMVAPLLGLHSGFDDERGLRNRPIHFSKARGFYM